MKINWTKEQCIEYIENNFLEFTEGEIELFNSSIKMFSHKERIVQEIALENCQKIIEFLAMRKSFDTLGKELFPSISFYKNDYWKERCLTAENYIEESPCDYDIYPKQYEAYQKWCNLKNKKL